MSTPVLRAFARPQRATSIPLLPGICRSGGGSRGTSDDKLDKTHPQSLGGTMRKALFLVAAGLLLSGCAGSPPLTEVQVTMTEFGFQPSEFSVTAGQYARKKMAE